MIKLGTAAGRAHVEAYRYCCHPPCAQACRVTWLPRCRSFEIGRSRNFSPPSPSAGGDYDDDEYDGSWRPTADEVEARWAEALGRLPDDEAAAVHARWAAGSASSPGANVVARQ